MKATNECVNAFETWYASIFPDSKSLSGIFNRDSEGYYIDGDTSCNWNGFSAAYNILHGFNERIVMSKTFTEKMESMHLHERITDGGNALYGSEWFIIRVPGGWIYKENPDNNGVFVPYNNEFFLKYEVRI